jgi:hypothetical protein
VSREGVKGKLSRDRDVKRKRCQQKWPGKRCQQKELSRGRDDVKRKRCQHKRGVTMR